MLIRDLSEWKLGQLPAVTVSFNTKPGKTMFDQKIDIDLKFKAPLPK